MSASPDGHQYKCRPCMREYKRRWERENADRLRVQRKNGDIRRYGIEPADFELMLVEQGGLCAICRGLDQRGDQLHIDHCHTSGKVRGLLCGRCNRGLGMFLDSPNLLVSAIQYLLDANPVTAVAEDIIDPSDLDGSTGSRCMDDHAVAHNDTDVIGPVVA